MIEKDLIKFLNEKLNVPAYLERPKDAPKSFIIIERTSGGVTNHIEYPTIAFQSYAPRLEEAAELNEVLKNVMEQASTLPRIGYARLNSDYNFTDATTKEYRYQAIYNFSYL